MSIEIWKDIQGYEGFYQVSNLGNVRSLIFRNKQTIKNRIKILKKIKQNKGYFKIILSGENKKRYFIHRLVAQAFLQNPKNKRTVNHINGIRDDNRVENLEWATDSENIMHSYKYLGRKKVNLGMTGIKCKFSKKIFQFSLDGSFIKEWSCAKDVERELKIPQGNICRCCKGNRKKAGGYKWAYNDTK